MSPIETQENTLSEDTGEYPGSASESLKLVPVAESIRYRKRAQSAEKRNETLVDQLTEAKSEVAKMAKQLSDMQVEQKLMRKLVAAGTIDLETAVLIAKDKMEGSDDSDLDSVIEQLRKEKQHLFGDNNSNATTAKKTAGAKDRVQNSQTILERTAKKAATTGNRTDLQEYLRLRRNFI